MEWNYNTVNEFLDKDSFKVLPELDATHFLRGTHKSGDIYLYIYGTKIIAYHPDNTFTLYHGGFQTRLIQNRLTTFGPAEVISQGGNWYLHTKTRDLPLGFLFRDGMKVDSCGYPII